MDPNDRLTHEVWPLVDQMLDGLITRGGMEQLERALDGNTTLQKSVIQYCQLHVNLHCDARSKKVVDAFIEGQRRAGQEESKVVPVRSAGPLFSGFGDEPREIGLASQPRNSGAWPLALAFSLGVVATVVGVAGWWNWRGRPEVVAAAPQGANVAPLSTPVAYLTADTGCAWENDSAKFRYVGSAADVGDEIALNEGIAEFRLSSGVYLSLEGPASMVLASPSALVLQYGKLTAHVPWTVTNFKAIASSCRVSACDAEFGIVQDGSKIEIHSFSGEVRAESPQAARGGGGVDVSDGDSVVVDSAGIFTKATITEGNALSLINEGELLKVLKVGGKAAPEKFATKLPMAGALAASTTYVNAVMASKPVGYWRFESLEGGVVPNEIAGGMALKVVGDPRITGRVDNSSLEFQPGSNCYLISEPFDALAGKDYSIEFWLKPSHVQRGGVLSLITNDVKENHAFYFELQGPPSQWNGPIGSAHPATFRYLLRDPPGGDPSSGTSCFSKHPYTLRRWQHVVAEKTGANMRLFVNGKRVGVTPSKGWLAPQLRLVLGQLETFTKLRKFVGQLDEVAIYDRTLPAEEVAEHYNAVEWKPSQKQTPSDVGA
jgi:Concanavalin A-like lectin/glucanases superfamily